ncbi:MAG: transglycosylase domain-containing protein [Oscillospiraceae bacterium]|nr:transglycosylase domain-containing protein [Oscillospiraceae bacterium]
MPDNFDIEDMINRDGGTDPVTGDILGSGIGSDPVPFSVGASVPVSASEAVSSVEDVLTEAGNILDHISEQADGSSDMTDLSGSDDDDPESAGSGDQVKKEKKSRKKKKRAKAAAALEEERRKAEFGDILEEQTSAFDTYLLDITEPVPSSELKKKKATAEPELPVFDITDDSKPASAEDASAAAVSTILSGNEGVDGKKAGASETETGKEAAVSGTDSPAAEPAAETEKKTVFEREGGKTRRTDRKRTARTKNAEGNTKSGSSDDDVKFDAVVGADGAIKGVLDGKDDSSRKEIPAVIAAASEREKKVKGGNSSANAQKSKKGNTTSAGKKNSKAVVTGTSAKITGSKNKRVRRRASFFQVLVRLMIFFICVGILGACALAVGVTMYIADVTVDDEKMLNLDNIKLSLATSIMVQDPDTGEWYEHERIYGGENREWVEYSDFPDCLIDSIIASEDIRFRTHHGVDWKRTAFAFLNTFLRLFNIELASNIQGGSTITQQLIKNITNEKDVEGLDGILRKIREIYRALEMEKNYSKTQILEAYLNTFRLGGQVAGIESAAKYYFGKTTADLDLAECCSIVCITKYPGAYDPYIDPEENKTQREFILWTMLDQGLITRTQYDSAMAKSEEMVFDESTINAGATSKIYDYFTDVIIDQVYEDLKKYLDLSPDDAYTLLYEGGLKIYTTMNPKIQRAVESAAWDDDIWPDYEYDGNGNKEENQIEGAIVVMNYDGQVLGCAGGIREKTTSLSLSRAYSTTRQTGSSMKPLAVYAPAIEMKKVHFSSLFPDIASEYYNGYPWPRNFSYTYGSPVTIYKAVVDSLNTIAALTMQLVGPDFSFDFLTSSMGFTTLVDNRWDDYQGMYLTDRTKSLALGGLTDGCTVTEMCAAYATFGNNGVYKSPRYYTIIEDSNGDIVLDKNKVCQTNQALSPQTAYIMNQILQGVTREGTGTTLNRGTYQVTACKTGTSSDNNDFWVCALNPYYCVAGWMGYDLNGWMNYSEHYDIQYAVRDVLIDISNDLPYKDFARPDGIVTATFCMSSGDIATSACGNRRTGYYTSDNYPSGSCMHTLYNNDGNGGYYG